MASPPPLQEGISGDNDMVACFAHLSNWIKEIEVSTKVLSRDPSLISFTQTRLSVESLVNKIIPPIRVRLKCLWPSTKFLMAARIGQTFDMGIFSLTLPPRLFYRPEAPTTCLLHDVGWWALQDMSKATESQIGTLQSVQLYRAKDAPFYPEFLVACFRNEDGASSWARVERRPRSDSGGPMPFSPAISGIISATEMSFSSKKMKSITASIHLATLNISFDPTHSPSGSPTSLVSPICFGDFVRRIISTVNFDLSYPLFTAHCRWLIRGAFVDMIKLAKLFGLQHTLKWEDTVVTREYLTRMLRPDVYIPDQGQGLEHRTAMFLAISQLNHTGQGDENDLVGPLVAYLEGAPVIAADERAILLASLLNTRASIHISHSDLPLALADSTRATALLRSLPRSDDQARGELISSIHLLATSLRALGRFEEAIHLMEECIRLGEGTASHASQSLRKRELAINYHHMGRLEDAKQVLVDVLETRGDSSEQDSSLERTNERLCVLAELSEVLSSAGDHSEAFRRLWEREALTNDLYSTGGASVDQVWEALADLIKFAFEVNQPSVADVASSKAVSIMEALPEHQMLYALALASQSRARYQLGLVKVAVELQYRAIGILETQGTKLGSMMFTLGIYLRQMSPGGMDEALTPIAKSTELILEEWRAHPTDMTIRSTLLAALGLYIDLLTDLDRLDECAQVTKVLVDILYEIPVDANEHDVELADRLEALGCIYFGHGKSTEGIKSLEDAAALLHARLDKDGSTPARVLLRNVLLRKSEFLDSLGATTEAYDVFQAVRSLILEDEVVEESFVTRLIHGARQAMSCNDAERAGAVAALGSAICRRAGGRFPLLSSTLSLEAEALHAAGDTAQALLRQQEALSVFLLVGDKTRNDAFRQALLLSQTSILLHASSQNDTALTLALDSAQIYRSLDTPENKSAALELLAFFPQLFKIYVAMGRAEEAARLTEEQMQAIKNLHRRNESGTNDIILARAYETLALQYIALVARVMEEGGGGRGMEESSRDGDISLSELQTNGLEAAREFISLYCSAFFGELSAHSPELKDALQRYFDVISMLEGTAGAKYLGSNKPLVSLEASGRE